MTTMDKVNKIKADIAALPAEAQALFQQEQSWASKYPNLSAALVGVAAIIVAVQAVALILKHL